MIGQPKIRHRLAISTNSLQIDTAVCQFTTVPGPITADPDPSSQMQRFFALPSAWLHFHMQCVTTRLLLHVIGTTIQLFLGFVFELSYGL
jgi:hypothetical protein